MRKFQRYIKKNWMFILVAILLECKAIESAYAFRGYKAVGGEIFVIPLFLLLIETVRKVISLIGYGWEED